MAEKAEAAHLVPRSTVRSRAVPDQQDPARFRVVQERAEPLEIVTAAALVEASGRKRAAQLCLR